MDFESFRGHTSLHVYEARSFWRVLTKEGKLILIMGGTIPCHGLGSRIKKKGKWRKLSPALLFLCFLVLHTAGSRPKLSHHTFPATMDSDP